ncbi:reverse transcriptase family protein [Marinobacter sp. 2_MG-2023]|uniref:reverse transcriptase family protein n=1 Tax=Marinobacter sp. 2_MG-2023 TaxID=3062679 RepID=UPI0034C6885A
MGRPAPYCIFGAVMDDFLFHKVSTASISNVKNLCTALDITETDLEKALSLEPSARYEEVQVNKSDGSLRTAFKPHYLIRRIQRRINKRIFAPQKNEPSTIQWPNYIFGSIPNQIIDGEEIQKDYISCARRHCKAKSLLKIDIKSFFDNIHSDLVYDVFNEFFKYPKSVCEVLTDICCHENRVPQGGLTSSYLASLVLHDIEPTVAKRLLRKGLRYTRLVDDITVSSKIHDYDFSFPKKIITDMLYEKDFPINEQKTRIEREASTPLCVHGLRICFNEPRLASHEVKNIRAAVKNIEIVAKERHYRTTHPYRKDYNRCLGRVNKLARVGHNQHAKLVSRLKKVEPLPSKRDIKRCTTMVTNLEMDHRTKGSRYWYWRRYNKAHQRLNILQRTFVHTANDLRARLKLIRPSYES